jgi:hypothetical protein
MDHGQRFSVVTETSAVKILVNINHYASACWEAHTIHLLLPGETCLLHNATTPLLFNWKLLLQLVKKHFENPRNFCHFKSTQPLEMFISKHPQPSIQIGMTKY